MSLRRVCLPVLAVILVVTVTLVGFEQFTGVATAAPVGRVTQTAPLQVPVDIARIAPGDKGKAGSFQVAYEGNEQAWVGLDAELLGPLAQGTSPLTVTVSDGQKVYGQGEEQVVGLFSPGELITLDVSYEFPAAAGNEYQSASATLFLVLYAVGATENTVYRNGSAVAPISWTRGSEVALAAVRNATPPMVVPCEGEGCAPENAAAVTGSESVGAGSAQSSAPAPVEVTTPVPSNLCCQCLQSVLWIGLLFALLLVIGMLGAFYLGWRLGTRSRSRPRVVRLKRADHPTDP